ncbi:MAG: SPOR domain-containing protein [Candidatus Margulisiibacteriota bacterium]
MENLNQNPSHDLNQQPAQEPIEDSQLLHDIPRPNRFLVLIKNLLILFLLVGVIAGSFWVSFSLGKKLLMPVKKQSLEKIAVSIPEPPTSIAHLQELDKISEEAAEPEAADVQEEKSAPVVHKPKVGKKSTAAAGPSGKYYKVQAGVFADKQSANSQVEQLRAAGFETFVRKVSQGWRVQVGAYRGKSWAQELQSSLKAKGFDSGIIYE